MKVAITGANGFLGSHLVEQSVLKGYETVALVRKGANLSNLADFNGYQTAPIDFRSDGSLHETLDNLGTVDLFIHNAGLTKSYTLNGYIEVNVDITKRMVEALNQLPNASSVRFAYISSLAAKGPVGNNGPASNYGRSKLMAEEIVQSSGLTYTIFRPTGIYGRRDVQFVPLIKAVKFGLYPLMTSKEHKMTLINAADAAKNILDLSLNPINGTVHLEDGNIYTHSDLKVTLEAILKKRSLNLAVPGTIVKTLLAISDVLDKLLNRTPTLSLEHYREISQNWDHDFTQERLRSPLSIEYTLRKGFEDAVEYYQQKHLI